MKPYYNPVDLNDIKKCMDDYKSEGFEPALTKLATTIKRETNKYNKYMKWHIESLPEDKCISSEWTKTRSEAIRKLSSPVRPLTVGDKRMLFHYNDIRS